MSEAGQERAIGRIEGKLDLIISDQEKARQDRKQQYDKQEKTDRTLDEVMRKLQSVDKRLEKVEEPVADFNRWRERGVGAVMLVSFFAAIFGAVIASFWKKVLALVTG
jgi:3-methyladenine DNA glycosylase/8-oxoguanine DNA glycosylase